MAELGAGWLPIHTTTPEELLDGLARLRAAYRDAGRDPADLHTRETCVRSSTTDGRLDGPATRAAAEPLAERGITMASVGLGRNLARRERRGAVLRGSRPRVRGVVPASRLGSRDPLVAYLSTFVVLGVVLGMLGPALPSLRAQVGASVSGISFVFVAQSARIPRRRGRRLVTGSIAATATACWRARWCSWPAGCCSSSSRAASTAMCAAFVVLGLAIGFVEVGSNTLLLWARNPTSPSTINLLHFIFGVGALASPLLVNRSLSARGNAHVAYVGAALAGVFAAAVVLSRATPQPVDVGAARAR